VKNACEWRVPTPEALADKSVKREVSGTAARLMSKDTYVSVLVARGAENRRPFRQNSAQTDHLPPDVQRGSSTALTIVIMLGTRRRYVSLRSVLGYSTAALTGVAMLAASSSSASAFTLSGPSLDRTATSQVESVFWRGGWHGGWRRGG
jgi:hypothetical protein